MFAKHGVCVVGAEQLFSMAISATLTQFPQGKRASLNIIIL